MLKKRRFGFSNEKFRWHSRQTHSIEDLQPEASPKLLCLGHGIVLPEPQMSGARKTMWYRFMEWLGPWFYVIMPTLIVVTLLATIIYRAIYYP